MSIKFSKLVSKCLNCGSFCENSLDESAKPYLNDASVVHMVTHLQRRLVAFTQPL